MKGKYNDLFPISSEYANLYVRLGIKRKIYFIKNKTILQNLKVKWPWNASLKLQGKCVQAQKKNKHC